VIWCDNSNVYFVSPCVNFLVEFNGCTEVYVIADNQGYRILKQRLKAFHGNENYIGMDFLDPPIDFVGLARSLGMTAERIEDPAAVRPALEASVASGQPTLLDVVVERAV
jgi:benzoylformate decarboxylase